MPETNARIKVCHDTAANFKTNNPTLLVGEWALETDTKRMKIGDGTTAYNSLPYSTAEESTDWEKPKDWIDIRSGAIANSIYALVGHSSNYSVANNLGFNAVLSNTSDSYEVYIDGNLYGTFTSGQNVKLQWSTLNLSTGSTTTTPVEFTTHIIRITPVTFGDTITKFTSVKYASGTGEERQGWLWVHFALNNSLERVQMSEYNGALPYYLVAITALDNILKIRGNSMVSFLGSNTDRYTHRPQYVAKLPVIEVNDLDSCSGMFNYNGPLKKITLNVTGTFIAANNGPFISGNGCHEIEINKPIIINRVTASGQNCFFRGASSLEKIPCFYVSETNSNLINFLQDNVNLKPIILDFRSSKSCVRMILKGSSTGIISGLKGVYVSNEAPFDNATSPQIDVSYTGLDRAALVNLFKSMPYNVGYEEVGSPTITDGVASGFSASDRIYANNSIIATGNFEYNIKFTTSANVSGNQWVFGQSITGNLWCGMYTTGHGITISITEENGSSKFCSVTYSLQANTTYTVNVKRINNVVTSTLYDNASTELVSNSTTITGKVVFNKNNFGGNPNNYSGNFSGSIDLNETYIKINGIPWFRGAAATTKTVSVVGCPGTADLTAADKAIAEDKGWELVLS